MGSAQSYVSSELVGTALTGLVIAGAFGLGFTRLNNTHVKPDEGTPTSADSTTKKGKKKKQNKTPAGAAAASTTITPTELLPPQPQPPQLAYLSNTIPGQFDVNPRHHVTQDSSATENLLLLPKTKKPKRKKTKTTTTTTTPLAEDAPKNLSIVPSDYHSESSSIQPLPKSSRRSPQPEATANPILSSQQQPLHNTTTSPLDTDSSWTQVGSKRTRKSSITTTIPHPSAAESQSEASFTTTTSQKDNDDHDEPSPRNITADEDTHDSFLLQQPWDSQNRIKKTIVEKLIPDPLKTGIEDMLEPPENPNSSPSPSRIKPLSNEKPVTGFSWADYEDVRVTTDGGENDADGEDDDGWGVVTSKRQRRINTSSSSTGPHQQPLKASETLTKRQRQNLQKREQQKATKAETETLRLTALATHKRELEKLRIQELLLSAKPSSSKPSGGMKASVDQRGNLIWE